MKSIADYSLVRPGDDAGEQPPAVEVVRRAEAFAAVAEVAGLEPAPAFQWGAVELRFEKGDVAVDVQFCNDGAVDLHFYGEPGDSGSTLSAAWLVEVIQMWLRGTTQQVEPHAYLPQPFALTETQITQSEIEAIWRLAEEKRMRDADAEQVALNRAAIAKALAAPGGTIGGRPLTIPPEWAAKIEAAVADGRIDRG